MAVTDYNEEERELLRQARAMKELIDTKPWQIYSQIIESQIKTRENILMDSPPGTVSELQAEHIKGARLGLRLALETVRLIITDATDVAREHGASEGDDE